MNDRRKNPEIPIEGGRRLYDVDPGVFVTVSAAAAHLGVSEKLVRKFIAAKSLKAHRFGSDIRIHRDALRAFVDGAASL